MKAIAVDTIFLVVVISMITIVSLIVLYQWYGGQEVATSQTACAIKFTNYCIQWAKNQYDPAKPPFDWSSSNPTGCGQLSPPINQPKSAKECIGVGS